MIDTSCVRRVVSIQLKAVQPLINLASKTATARLLRWKVLTGTAWFVDLIE
jgi:hypothetical protein